MRRRQPYQSNQKLATGAKGANVIGYCLGLPTLPVQEGDYLGPSLSNNAVAFPGAAETVRATRALLQTHIAISRPRASCSGSDGKRSARPLRIRVATISIIAASITSSGFAPRGKQSGTDSSP